MSDDKGIPDINHGPGPSQTNDGMKSSKERIDQQRAPSPAQSHVSTRSDWSMERLINFSDGEKSAVGRFRPKKSEASKAACVQQPPADLDSIFELLEENVVRFVRKELKTFRRSLSGNSEEEEVLVSEDEEQRGIKEALMKLAVKVLRAMEQEELADALHSRGVVAQCQHTLKKKLKQRLQRVCEGVAKAGEQTALNEIYTELHITQGGSGEVNQEHEVRQLEAASRRPQTAETTIRPEDIFKASPTGNQPIRRLMTKGVAGIGKTLLTQKFCLDWAEGKAHQNIQLIFPFTFRELNALRGKRYSLMELLHQFFTPTKEAGICSFKDLLVLFILDGLDESRLSLDFHSSEILTDVTKSSSLEVLLTNLISGNLLPSARLWITSRPAAATQIPPESVDRVTEVRGFTDHQKEEYFRKRFRGRKLASSIISHIRSLGSIYIMCHIPVFCWITATVLEDMMETRDRGELPKSLTEMYILFLLLQTKVKNLKYDGAADTDPLWTPESQEMIVSLGKLAHDQLQRGNLIFYESDLTECGINITTASVFSGVFTQVFREEKGLFQDKVFCFVHLSVQEFLAALYVHQTFIRSGEHPLPEDQPTSWWPGLLGKTSKLSDLHQRAVDEALQSPNGHLDLFLRFLLGLSLETNQTLLRGCLKQTGSSSETNQEAVQYIKQMISETVSPDRTINLFHCLNELRDFSLVEEIQKSLNSGRLPKDSLSPAQWSALALILLSSYEAVEVFDLKAYSASEEALLRLLPVVKASRKTVLDGCNLSGRSCEALSSVLSSPSYSLRDLDFSNNDLQDSGVICLSTGLASPNCLLESLRLSGCNLSWRSCEALSSVLSSPSSKLKHLDLSNNQLQDSGVTSLSAGLASLHCPLESLSLLGCMVTHEGCASLVSALITNPYHMKKLDLSYNHPGDTGQRLLSAGLQSPDWGLKTLRMDHGGPQRIRAGLKKYACELDMDPKTANKHLKLSDNNRKVTRVERDQKPPDHPERFDWPQLLSRNGLTSRCYWEVELDGNVYVSVSYREIGRKGRKQGKKFGANHQSWSLNCSDDLGYSVWHDNTETLISVPVTSRDRRRIGVYVDCPAGTVSFYRVSDTLTHLHTFTTTFTHTLYAGFGLWTCKSSVTMCSLKDSETQPLSSLE